jgi:uncharacterized protein with HEPN domain
MPSLDAEWSRHMRKAAGTALEMATGHDRAVLSTNTAMAMALTGCLEFPGEAASKISPEVCAKFPASPYP